MPFGMDIATARYAEGLRKMECLARAVRDKHDILRRELKTGNSSSGVPVNFDLKLLVAFHQACDQRDLETAERLLQFVRRGCDVDALAAAYERLRPLLHQKQ